MTSITNSWLIAVLALGVIPSTSAATAFVPHLRQNLVKTSSSSLAKRRTPLSLPYQLCPECETDMVVKSTTMAGGLMSSSSKQELFGSYLAPLPAVAKNDELMATTRTVSAPTIVSAPTLADVSTSFFPSDTDSTVLKTFPLVVTAKHDSSLKFLTSFLKTNREWIDKMNLKYGAVLFRGFDIDDAKDVEMAIQSYQPKLSNDYRGTSPRSAQDGTKFVFSAAEVPSTYPIAQHIEMSFLPSPPRQLFFSALQAPKAVGGETALADFRKVYQDLPQRLREKLATKKIKYTRTHGKVGARFTHDVASMQSWSDVFATSDKAEVERISRKENLPMRWTGKNQDTFVSEYESEPFQLHPDTKEPVWFNHAQVFHWTTFPAELFLAFMRTKEPRFLVRAVFTGLVSVLKYGVLSHKMALDASFGDGTPISIREMHQIRSAIHKNTVFNRWQKGDLVLIDNFSTSHGRQPTYDKGRKIVVAWSNPLAKSNEASSSQSTVKTMELESQWE